MSLTDWLKHLFLQWEISIFGLEVVLMKDISSMFNINLKTGFFKTESYILSIEQESLKLIPANKNRTQDGVVIQYSDIKTVNVSSGMPVEMEIITENKTYIGAFERSKDISGVINNFKNVLGKSFHIFNL